MYIHWKEYFFFEIILMKTQNGGCPNVLRYSLNNSLQLLLFNLSLIRLFSRRRWGSQDFFKVITAFSANFKSRLFSCFRKAFRCHFISINSSYPGHVIYMEILVKLGKTQRSVILNNPSLISDDFGRH